MNLVEKIFQIYPNLTNIDFMEHVILQDDSNGQGAYIAKWEHPSLAKPTDDQLKAI